MCPGTVETQLWKLESMQISMENKQRRDLSQKWDPDHVFPQPKMRPNIPRSYSMPPPCSRRWHQDSKKPVILINLDMSIPNSTSEIYRNKLHLRIHSHLWSWSDNYEDKHQRTKRWQNRKEVPGSLTIGTVILALDSLPCRVLVYEKNKPQFA